AERGEPRVDEGTGGLQDVPQHLVEVDRPGHLQVGAQQPAQPAPGGLHVTRSADELFEKLVELQPRRVDEARFGVLAGPGARLRRTIVDRTHPLATSRDAARGRICAAWAYFAMRHPWGPTPPVSCGRSPDGTGCRPYRRRPPRTA